MARKGHVSEEQMDAAIDSIRVTGKFVQACNILGISKQVWCQWRKGDAELAARVDAALETSWSNSDYTKRAIADAIVIKTLREGVVTEYEVEREALNADGEMVLTSEKRKVRTGPPLKLLQMYLQPISEELGLVQQLADSGYLSQEHLEIIQDAYYKFKQTISEGLKRTEEDTDAKSADADELAEAATAAIQRVLTTASAEVSGAVSSRPIASEGSSEK